MFPNVLEIWQFCHFSALFQKLGLHYTASVCTFITFILCSMVNIKIDIYYVIKMDWLWCYFCRSCLVFHYLDSSRVWDCAKHYSDRSHFTLTRVTAKDMEKQWTLIHFWWEWEMGQPFWKIVWQFLKKLNKFTLQPSNSALRYLPNTTEEVCPHKNLYVNTYSSIIHNRQKVESTQTSINWRMDK